MSWSPAARASPYFCGRKSERETMATKAHLGVLRRPLEAALITDFAVLEHDDFALYRGDLIKEGDVDCDALRAHAPLGQFSSSARSGLDAAAAQRETACRANERLEGRSACGRLTGGVGSPPLVNKAEPSMASVGGMVVFEKIRSVHRL